MLPLKLKKISGLIVPVTVKWCQQKLAVFSGKLKE
jgi:hypothetical protein